MYERVDIIFVVSRPMVGVLLYVVQVLDHMAEDTRLTIVIEAAGVIVIIIMMTLMTKTFKMKQTKKDLAARD